MQLQFNKFKNKSYISNKIKKIFKNDFRINISKSLENIYILYLNLIQTHQKNFKKLIQICPNKEINVVCQNPLIDIKVWQFQFLQLILKN